MQYTSVQAHPGAANQNQIKSSIRDYRAESELHQSCEDFETRITASPHLPWDLPEAKLLKAQLWRLGHGLSDTPSLSRLRKCSRRDLGVLHSLHFLFYFISFSSALPTGRKRCSQREIFAGPWTSQGLSTSWKHTAVLLSPPASIVHWPSSKETTWLTPSDSFRGQTDFSKILGHLLMLLNYFSP